MSIRAVGTRFDDRFQLLKVLGHGAMGHVYEVSDELLQGARWALKELDLGVVLETEKEEAIALFHQEIAILRQVSHPGCPRLVHEFVTDTGSPAFVMTRVEGIPLDLLVEQLDRPLSVYETLPILLQVCHIFEHLHTHQPPIIFRDLKPSNLMLTDQGTVVLIDFGIARRFDPKKSKDTQELGTPGFCSPEQYGRGQTTEQSDIYSLATTAYFLLTRADVQSFSFQFPPLSEHLTHEKVEELSVLLDSMLSLKASERPATTIEVRERLVKIYRALGPNRERSTRILTPSLKALTEFALEPTKQLRVFDRDFFRQWFRAFF